jgi:CBS domain-containing protein
MRTRRVVGARREVSESTVRCPTRAASITATECLACSDCLGAVTTSTGTYLRCQHPAAHHAALVEMMRQPLFSSAADRTPLLDVMTGDVVCVGQDLGLAELTELFLELDIGGAPVVDDECRPLGVVSRSDLIAVSDRSATVASIMMAMAFTLPETATLSRAAALMAFEGVHRIPVVSAEGRVVGIISSLDIARWLAQNDGYIAPGSPAHVRTDADEDR